MADGPRTEPQVQANSTILTCGVEKRQTKWQYDPDSQGGQADVYVGNCVHGKQRRTKTREKKTAEEEVTWRPMSRCRFARAQKSGHLCDARRTSCLATIPQVISSPKRLRATLLCLASELPASSED